MTEAEWLDETDAIPRQLLILDEVASARKLLLIAAIFVRGAQLLPENEYSKRCDDLIEDVADRPRTQEEILPELESRMGNWRFTYILGVSREPRAISMNLRQMVALLESSALPAVRDLIQLLHEVIGNPFRPVVFSADWRSSDAVAIARTMYESRDFGAMPILADALQDAGCENEDILSHCRDTTATHVRGCWVVDLVLGKD